MYQLQRFNQHCSIFIMPSVDTPTVTECLFVFFDAF